MRQRLSGQLAAKPACGDLPLNTRLVDLDRLVTRGVIVLKNVLSWTIDRSDFDFA